MLNVNMIAVNGLLSYKQCEKAYKVALGEACATSLCAKYIINSLPLYIEIAFPYTKAFLRNKIEK